MSGVRLRVPEDLAARLSARSTREGAGSSVAMVLRILYAHVDEDLPPDKRGPTTLAAGAAARR